MKTRQLVLGTLLLLAALTLAHSAVRADPGTAPIIPNANAKPHSDAWNDSYLDKYAVTSLPIHTENAEREPLRGGLAGLHAYPYDAKPSVPRAGIQSHSDAWDARIFDRDVNTRLPYLQIAEPRLLWRGGLAKGADLVSLW